MEEKFSLITVGIACLLVGAILGAVIWGEGTIVNITELETASIEADYQNKIDDCEYNHDLFVDKTVDREEQLLQDAVNVCAKANYEVSQYLCFEQINKKLMDLNKTILDMNCNYGGDVNEHGNN